MREAFIDWNPASKTRVLLQHVQEVLTEFASMGYRLTLRQLYYQLVGKDLIPNKQRQYKNLGNIVSKARLAGIIDWDMIEDRVRNPKRNAHWDDPGDIVRAAAEQYYRDRWVEQENYVEVWCQKDAVSNIIEPVCKKWDVLFMANRGYSSQSAMYEAYHRFESARLLDKKNLVLLYFGDHDPSGLDMVEDISNRLGLFLNGMESQVPWVYQIALNKTQVREYNLPENPAKVTDSRYEKYMLEHGTSSWELDALQPQVLESLVEGAILDYCDQDAFAEQETIEVKHKKKIVKLSKEF